LRIEYPIIQGGMAWLSNPELVAAVSNAGGLGTLRALSVTQLHQEVAEVRSLTDKPFADSIPLLAFREGEAAEMIDAAIEAKVPAVTISGGDPFLYTSRLKDAGIKVLQVVFSVRHAKRAEKAEVDVVIASGYEGGGHLSFEELPTFVLVPQVVDAVRIPVIAAGGIGDARGMAAALALGAEGIQMGTRFIATKECGTHPAYKEAVLKASDTATVVTARKISPVRCLRNEFATKLLEMENRGASIEEFDLVGTGKLRQAAIDGDIGNGSLMCGAIAGMITEVMSVAEVIQQIVTGYEAIVARLQ
jgi:enoyl-[acyl-carrier protein] reductase II